jgi:Skp family chaperone for outer membrane proteins
MRPRLALLGFLAGLAFSGVAEAQQGVSLKSGAVVYYGSASTSTAPAVIDEDRVRESTPEWKTIQAEGVKKGSARYKLLAAEMDKRIRDAVRAAAEHGSRDLVVRSGDIDDARGKTAADLTSEAISRLDGMPE